MDAGWQVELTLVNGERRILADSQGAADTAQKRLNDLVAGHATFSRADWLETTDGSFVAVTHVIEARVVAA